MAERVAGARFGTLLREYRLAAGLTQEALAERAAMSPNGIGALERGDRRAPRFVTVKLLADALGLSPAARTRFEAAAHEIHLAGEATSACDAEQAGERTNLPLLMTSFHGRDHEIEQLSQLIGERRLVTICGPGGIGKTRLAIECARAIAGTGEERFKNGIWLVELAPLNDPALVASRIAQVLGIEEEGSVPVLQTLVRTLRDRPLLLVLDNCEHLVEAAAHVAHPLLTQCRRLSILATSREPLRVSGERVVRLNPLGFPQPAKEDVLPSLDELRASPAVRLFFDRASDVAPTVALGADDPSARGALATIAQRLEGIPLAIELAAARMSSLTLTVLARRLDDRFRLLAQGNRTAPPRQQTLRAMLDWSYGLLAAPEQQLFQRLGIFADGWTLEAVQSVCSDESIAPDDIPQLLSSLVDKSLVLAETAGAEPRYRFLETMRAYALEQLAQHPGERERMARRHAQHYCAAATRIDAALESLRDSDNDPLEAAVNAMEAALDNVRVALSWALGEGADAELGSALAAAACFVFYRRSLYAEGASWCERALAALGERPPPEREADLQWHLALLYKHLYGPEPSCSAAKRAATLYRQLGQRGYLGNALALAAQAVYFRGDRVEADRLATEALELAREQDTVRLTIAALYVKGLTTDPREAHARRGLLDEALAICRRHPTAAGESIGLVLATCGQVAFEAGDLDHAREAARRSIRERANTKGLAAFCRTRLAAYALAAGDPVEASTASREVLRILSDRASPRFISAVEILAGVAALHGDHGQAARLLGAVDAHLAALRKPRDVVQEAVHEQVLALLRAGSLNQGELVRLTREGAVWSAERMVEEALAVQ
jgi:predicted ATPase/DNA-binding XRE family transcriptional regulator